jgi:hypothetical protein
MTTDIGEQQMKRKDPSRRICQQGGLAGALVALMAGAMVQASAAQGGSLFVHEGVTLESQGAADIIKLRKLGVPDVGIKSGRFQWDPAQNAWMQKGSLAADGFSEWMALTNYGDAVDFEAAGMAIGVSSATLKTPKGAVYSLRVEGPWEGFSAYMYSSERLPIGQQSFTDGKYVFTYRLASGATVTRTCYLSGTYPNSVKITSPSNGATGVPVNPTIKWTAIGAASYRIFVNEDGGDGDDVWRIDVNNAHEVNLAQSIPPGVLKRGTRYHVSVNAESPRVNCGYKVLEAGVDLTTAP